MRHPLHHLKIKSPVLVPGFSDCGQNIPNQYSQADRHSREGGNPVSFNGAWIPGLRSASPGMTIVINRQANSATQPPASPNATNRTNHTPNKHSSLPVAPKTHLTPRATTLPHGRHTNPAIDDRPFDMSERTIAPLATGCCLPTRQPDQPIPCRSNADAIRAR